MAWKNLYSKSSFDHGTLAFWRSRLNRVSVTKEPKKNVDATIDFFETVTVGHWLSCACGILGITTLDGRVTIPDNILQGGPNAQRTYIRILARKVVHRLSIVDSAFLSGDSDSDDHIYNYARVLCHYGSLMVEFRDAWAEGDGERIVRCWRLFMPHFKTAGCTKYCLEALKLQIQLVTLSPSLAHQVKWHRFVNTRGGLGNNIPCDLHNEHVNRLVKRIIQNMGSNLTENSIQRAVRCVSPLYTICKQFDQQTGVPTITSAHKSKSEDGDIAIVIAQVLRRDLLARTSGRKHHSFPTIGLNPLDKWDKRATKGWIMAKISVWEAQREFS